MSEPRITPSSPAGHSTVHHTYDEGVTRYTVARPVSYIIFCGGKHSSIDSRQMLRFSLIQHIRLAKTRFLRYSLIQYIRLANTVCL